MWCLNRLCSARDGIELACQNDVVTKINESFLKYSHNLLQGANEEA